MNAETGKIVSATEEDHPKLLQIWERSVRATHMHFLKNDDVEQLLPLVKQAFSSFKNLFVFKENSDENCEGFIALDGESVEALFVDSDCLGKGIGTRLMHFALNSQDFDIKKVDVNEQNVKGVNFYKHMGFEVVGRSEVDGQGNPFPLLHMQYSKK